MLRALYLEFWGYERYGNGGEVVHNKATQGRAMNAPWNLWFPIPMGKMGTHTLVAERCFSMETACERIGVWCTQ